MAEPAHYLPGRPGLLLGYTSACRKNCQRQSALSQLPWDGLKQCPGLKGQYVKAKEYLYSVRPLLCARRLAAHPEMKFPPVRFTELLENDKELAPEVRQALKKLIKQKTGGAEMSSVPKESAIDAFIEENLAEKWPFRDDGPPAGWDDFEAIFLKYVLAGNAHENI